MATGRVGAEDLAADTDITVYQCPEGTFAAISATICNRSNEPILISLAVCAAETPEIYEYIEYETELHARGTFERTGIVLGEEKYLVARSNSANVNIVAYGIESLTAAYVPPTPSAPINTAAPVITGTAQQGETLTVSTGTWSGFPTPTYTYQWYNGTSPISGATSSTYVPIEDDVGDILRCGVTATNTSGSSTALTEYTSIVTGLMTEPSLVFTLVNPNAFSSSDGDRFGFYADLDTDWIVVGADRETNAGGATWPGRVYVYDAATGALEHSIANPNIDPATEEFDSFGVAMAVWGNKAITSTVETVSVGVGHVIDLSTGTIDRQLVNPNNFSTPNTDRFAINGAMDLWGDVAIVGAYSEDATGAGDTGCAYLMDITDGSLLHTLANPSPGANDGMGEHVAICENYAVTGIPYFEGAGSNSGRVYVWSVSTGSLVYTLDNPDPDGLPNSDWFGSALAVTNTHLLVGTKNEDQTGANGGAAYIYDLSDGSLLYTLLNENAFGDAAGDIFGVAVALTPTHAYIGASQEDGTGASNTGKVYVYDLATGDLVFTIDNPNDNGAEDFDTFGTTIRVSSDYSRLLVTALGETDENTAVTGGGKVYVFDI